MERRMDFLERLQNPPVYHYPNIDWATIEKSLENYVTMSNSRRAKYFQVPITFDIETTSFIADDGSKAACMYAFAYSIDGYVILGRTWDAVLDVYYHIVRMFNPIDNERVLIYIQNLAYEFQFMCHRFEWQKVFALKERKPITATTVDNVEFRCSYMLSGFSLAKIGENLQRYKIQKMVGDLDYSLPRHSKTPLTDKEWKYLVNDVQVVAAYIQETYENDGGYHKIPLTKTGYVRNYCREQCFKDKYYRKLMNVLTVDADEYKQLKRAFAGGFTHANYLYAQQTLDDLVSFDFTSSYPYTMVSEKFPMSKSVKVKPESDEEFRKYLRKFCCLFDIEIFDVDGWKSPDHIISRAKCRIAEEAVLDNGRIIEAKRIITTMTEVDFTSFEQFYEYSGYRIDNMRIYEKMYLPTPFVRAILNLYEDKTTLKDVEGKEVEYLKSKGMINAAYGMCVTDIVRDEDTFGESWEKNPANVEEAIEKYNKNVKRFLFYPWGVWVTAYARRNLFSGIKDFGTDYVYSDTDSIKVRNAEKHMDYIDWYNEKVDEKLRMACATHRIPFEMTRPKTIKGVEKPLGVWDFDGHYDRFKTLGAKRYMVEQNGKIKITVAGLNKQSAVPYMQQLCNNTGQDMFEIFDEFLEIPGMYFSEREQKIVPGTGKQTHTYNDYEVASYLVDYLGNTELVHEYSSIHLEPAEYSLSLAKDYVDLLHGIRGEAE